MNWTLVHKPYPVSFSASFVLVSQSRLTSRQTTRKPHRDLERVEFLRQLSSQDLFSPGDVADRINKKDPNALRAQHLALLDLECSRSARILHSLQDEKTLAKFKSIVTP